MARAQAQYLRIYDIGGTTYQRWQSYYVNRAVTFSSASWSYVPFIADGFTAGISGDEANIAITAPAISQVISAFEAALRNGRLCDLSIYQFSTEAGNSSPQADQELIAQYSGQAVGASAGLTNITLQLGSALSPIGAQIPPRKFTTAIMGKGCRL
jgi:hypothetical protein